MNSYGHNQVFFHLIGHGKEKPSHYLGYRDPGKNGVCQNKCEGAQYDGRRSAPSSAKAIKNSPEKNLFCDGAYETAYKKKKGDINRLRRKTGITFLRI